MVPNGAETIRAIVREVRGPLVGILRTATSGWHRLLLLLESGCLTKWASLRPAAGVDYPTRAIRLRPNYSSMSGRLVIAIRRNGLTIYVGKTHSWILW